MTRIVNKRLIFVISPGRCGTAWLAKTLDYIDGVTAVHEPDPGFVGLMRYIQHAPQTVAAKWWQKEKLPAIEKYEGDVYIETSLLFCMGFVEPLQACGVDFEAIVIKRPARDIALSHYWRGSIPGRTVLGFRYKIIPSDICSVPIEEPETLSDYQLCYWYALEIAARQEHYQRSINAAYVTHFDDMVTLEGLTRLTHKLGLRLPAEYSLPDKINVTPDKHKKMPDGNLDELEGQVLERMRL